MSGTQGQKSDSKIPHGAVPVWLPVEGEEGLYAGYHVIRDPAILGRKIKHDGKVSVV